MKTINFTKKIVLLGLLTTSSFFAVNANESASSIHQNMHELNNANSIYENWKLNRTANSDPFKLVAQGYKVEKNTARSDYIANIYQPSVENFVITSVEDKLADLEERRLFRDEQVSSIYSSSLNDRDEKIDTQNYLNEYQLYKEAKSDRAAVFYELRQVQLASMGIDSHQSNQNQNSFSGQRSHTATSNLLISIQNDMNERKTQVRDVFDDNITMAEQSFTFGEDARGLAASFSGECPACNLPAQPVTPVAPVTPPPDPISPPVYNPPVDPCFEERWRDQIEWSRHYYKCP